MPKLEREMGITQTWFSVVCCFVHVLPRTILNITSSMSPSLWKTLRSYTIIFTVWSALSLRLEVFDWSTKLSASFWNLCSVRLFPSIGCYYYCPLNDSSGRVIQVEQNKTKQNKQKSKTDNTFLDWVLRKLTLRCWSVYGRFINFTLSRSVERKI